MKIANWAFGLLFLAAAALQWNDPDPWGWILIYLFAGVISIVATYRPAVWRAAPAIAVAVLLWAIALLPQVAQDFQLANLFSSMKAEVPSIELSREFLGLLIILGWMIVIITRCRPGRSGQEDAVDRRRT